MHELLWSEDEDGFVAPGYRIRRLDNGRWRVEAPGSIGAIRAGSPPQTSPHRSAKEAMLQADQIEISELRRVAVFMHFSIALAALVTAILSSAIESLLGFAMLSIAVYVSLRSAANGLGLMLNDAWGWTRLSGPQRSSFLERRVYSAASRRRLRALRSIDRRASSVRTLSPIT